MTILRHENKALIELSETGQTYGIQTYAARYEAVPSIVGSRDCIPKGETVPASEDQDA